MASTEASWGYSAAAATRAPLKMAPTGCTWCCSGRTLLWHGTRVGEAGWLCSCFEHLRWPLCWTAMLGHCIAQTTFIGLRVLGSSSTMSEAPCHLQAAEEAR